ncbi:MAG TPA: ribosome silencing factor [Acidiferrobacteraceae bacterium]|nr:ribosome silencing factor [Acidiferrobacteraceae bacterium]
MQAEEMRGIVVTALEDLKAQDIQVLDVHQMTDIADFMVIATGTSSRHVKAMADKTIDAMKEHGHRPLGMEGEQEGEWVLVDFGDLILHVMLPATRSFYDLEKLWSRDLISKVEAQRQDSE